MTLPRLVWRIRLWFRERRVLLCDHEPLAGSWSVLDPPVNGHTAIGACSKCGEFIYRHRILWFAGSVTLDGRRFLL